MPTCKHCGKNIASDSVICPYCDTPYPFGKKNAVKSNSSYFSTPNYVKTEAISSNNNTKQEHRGNGTAYAISGFICSFLIPIIGIVLSSIGYSISKDEIKSVDKGLSIAGIYISIFAIIAWIVTLIIIFA